MLSLEVQQPAGGDGRFEEVVFYNACRWPWANVRTFGIGLMVLGAFLFASGAIAILITFFRMLAEDRIAERALLSTAVQGVMVSFGAIAMLIAWGVLRICVRVKLTAEGLELLRVFSKRLYRWADAELLSLTSPRSPWSLFAVSLQQFYSPGRVNQEVVFLLGKKGKKLALIAGAFERFREIPREAARISEGKIKLD